MYCPNCGSYIPDDSCVCNFCGCVLDDEAGTEFYGRTSGSRRRKRRPGRKKKDPLKWLLILFALLLIILIALLIKRFVLTDHGNGDNTGSEENVIGESQGAEEQEAKEEQNIQEAQEEQNTQEAKEEQNTQETSSIDDQSENAAESSSETALVESETQLSTEEQTGQEGTEEEISEKIDESVYYFRTRLEPEEQMIYDALLACAESEDPSVLGEELSVSDNPESDEFDLTFERACRAMYTDHPELFWIALSDSSFSYTYQTTADSEGRYPISFCFMEPLSNRKKMMQELEAAAEQLLAEVDLTKSDPEITLQVHDLLIDLVEYDYSAVSTDHNLAHTAYGALVMNDGKKANTAVCDGYSRAYQYLLQKAGICCLMICGTAGEDEDSAEPHSWNMVFLDGDWYETDCTWDDGDLTGNGTPIIAEALSDEAYLGKLKHYLFQVTTEEISDFEPGYEYRYESDGGWATFLSSSVHIRNTEEDAAINGDYMTPIAPLAYGTDYSYDNMR